MVIWFTDTGVDAFVWPARGTSARGMGWRIRARLQSQEVQTRAAPPAAAVGEGQLLHLSLLNGYLAH